MRKKILGVIVSLFLILLAACSKGGQTDKDTTPPILSGVKTIYHEIGQPMPNLLAGISAFDETDGNVTDLIVIDARDLNLGLAGDYLITYYAYDLSGNKTTQTASVNVAESTAANLDAPDYPDKNTVIKADVLSEVNLGNNDVLLEVMPPLFHIEYNQETARDLSWTTFYTISLAPNNYLRKTHLGLNILGSGVPIYLKLQTKTQVVLVEREVATTRIWKEVLIEIPETQRHLFNEQLELVVFAPKPTSGGVEGDLAISGIWFEGDAEPSVQIVYDPSEFFTIYEVDLSDLSNQEDSFDDNGYAGDNNEIRAVYDPLTDQLTFTNNGFNDWANIAFLIPDKVNGIPLQLNKVRYVVIELSVTEGAIVKAKSDWSSLDLFEYNGPKDNTMHYWVLPVGLNGYAAFAAISFAPSYLQLGYPTSTIVVKSIKLVAPIE